MKVLFGFIAGFSGLMWIFLMIDYLGRATSAGYSNINRPASMGTVTADGTGVSIAGFTFVVSLILFIVFHAIQKNRKNEN